MPLTTLTELRAGITTRAREGTDLLRSQSEQAERDNRVRTPDEIAAVDRLLGEARDLRAQLDRRVGDQAFTDEFARITRGIEPTTEAVVPSHAGGLVPVDAASLASHVSGGSWGQQFVTSDAYEFFRRGG